MSDLKWSNKMKVYTVHGSEDGLLEIYSSFKKAEASAIAYVNENDSVQKTEVLEKSSLVWYYGSSCNAYVETWNLQ
mgnify:CR=1 FL=1